MRGLSGTPDHFLSLAMTPEFVGKAVLITGASRGLGKALARAFWSRGANLLIAARQRAALEGVAEELRQHDQAQGQKIVIVGTDLSALDAPMTIVDAARAGFGRLDVMVLNAAVQGPIGPLWETDNEAWRHSINVNLVGPAMLASQAIPLLLQSGRGSVLFISGGGAAAARPNFSAYGTAKTGLVRLAETLAEELRSTGVRVNAMAPGAMPTEMLREVLAVGEDVSGEGEAHAAATVLSNGEGAMSKAVDLAVFLASDASRGITGKLISAVWDRYEDWPAHLDELAKSDLYTLRRITGRDRGKAWGDR